MAYLDIGKSTGLGPEHSKWGGDKEMDTSLGGSRCKVRSTSCAGKSPTQKVEVSVLSICVQAGGAQARGTNKHTVLSWGFWGPVYDIEAGR